MTDTPPPTSQPSRPTIEDQVAALNAAIESTEDAGDGWYAAAYGALATLRAHEAQSRELAEARKEIGRLRYIAEMGRGYIRNHCQAFREGTGPWIDLANIDKWLAELKEPFSLRAPSGKDAMEVALHPDTARLVDDFAAALTAKLTHAEEKYGYANDWLTQDWELECRQHLLDHIRKGDPLDVAAYCAFMWRKGWSTAGALPEIESKETTHSRYYNAFHAWFITGDCDFWSECDAPEQLASIAVELNDQYAARAITAACTETEARFRPLVEAGWKEATIAWSVCASIHREYGKRRDALYTTRQADFLKHETDARAALAALEEGNK